MLLSIIIPHYNLPRELLERCIDSIVIQDIPPIDYEIIIVDDGSDEPPQWVEERYTGIDIRLIHAAHSGPGGARNRGIDEAKGQYIEFVDADDMLIPNSDIHTCLDVLRRDMPQILCFNSLTFKSHGNNAVDKSKKIEFSSTMSGAAYMRDFNLSGSPCVYFFQRSLAIEKGIRFPENIFHEDEEFNTILHYHAQTLIYCNATLYRYCIREGSTTVNSSAKFETGRIENILQVIERLSYFRDTFSKECNATQAMGFEHKFTMLAVDAIINMMNIGMDAKSIYDTCRKRLTPLGIYPLPKASYSIKYRIFRLLANSKMGLKILRNFISSKTLTKE